MSANATLAGYLGKDFFCQEVATSKGGNVTIAEGSIANRTTSAKTTWTKVKALGKSGESLARLYGKGSFLSISGTPTLETWTDKETGEIRSGLVVQIENFSGSKA
jgi:single-stranded DNA-binding protein